MTPPRRLLGLGLSVLLTVLAVADSLRTTEAGDDASSRSEAFVGELRGAIAKLKSEDEAERLAAMSIVTHALSRKNASSHRWLTPGEYTLLGESAFDEALALLAASATGHSASLALGVLQGLARHSPDTKRVLARRVEELGVVFDAADPARMRALLSIMETLGEPADDMVPGMRTVLEGNDKRLSRQAGLTLGMIGGPRARAALREACAHDAEHVRSSAYRGWQYVRVLQVSEVRALLGVFADDRVGRLSLGTCVAFMGRIQDDSEKLRVLVTELTQVHLASPEALVRRAGCTLLGAIGLPARPAAAQLARLVSNDPDKNVRTHAARNLTQVDSSEKSAQVLMDAIEAPRNRDHQSEFIKLLRGVRAYARPLLPRLDRLLAQTESENVAYTTRNMILEIEREGLFLRTYVSFEAGADRVRCLAWSPTGDRVVAGCSDRTLRIWQPDTSKPIASLVLPRYG